ncbi:MAG: aminopeptidase P family protein [Ignavibacteria bacterium]|nr:aminopeptidase P family protein [Ignavibacteria bacterium]
MRVDFTKMQEAIRSYGADAWAIYDFRKTNDLAWSMLGVSNDHHCTRRWMVVVPAHGKPHKIVHKMEQDPLNHIKIDETLYARHEEWENAIRELTAPFKKIAMEYSPNNAIPVVSKVDAGIVELLRMFGHDVVSSGDIVQKFTAVLSEEQLAGAEVSAGLVRDIIHSAFELIRKKLTDGDRVTEYDVQRFILNEFERHELVTEAFPIVAIGPNASKPHYEPTISDSSEIDMNQIVLIDAWAKNKAPGSVYADLTWVAYTGREVPDDVEHTFRLIVNGRDAATDLVKDRFKENKPVYGYEVDDACRSVIEAGSMGSNYIHRTGHNITTEIHGPGANMDNFETHDTRQIIPGMSFSIEPGVYIDNVLGLRTEIGIIVHPDGSVSVPSSPVQKSIIPLFGIE